MLTSQVKHLVRPTSGTSCMINTPLGMVEIVLLRFWNTSDNTTFHFITPTRALRSIWSSWPFRMEAIHPPATRCHVPQTLKHLDPCFTGLLCLLCHFMRDIVHNIFPLYFWILFHAASWPLSCWRTLSLLFVKLGHRRCRSWSLGGAGERNLLKYFTSWRLFHMAELQGSLK